MERDLKLCKCARIPGEILKIFNNTVYCNDCGGVVNAATLALKAHKEVINHPLYYGGADNPYEAIKVIDVWGLSFALGNTVKYISRAGKKDPKKEIEDLEKAAWYLKHEIERLKKNATN